MKLLHGKKVLLEILQNLLENTCARCYRPQACNFIKKETLAQVLSCEFCEISNSTFLYRTRLVAACVYSSYLSTNYIRKTKMYSEPT